MVQKGVVLSHVVFNIGIDVDKAKAKVIEKLPPPSSVNGVRSFLRHVGFYRRFMKDFSKFAKPLIQLLVKDVPFEFNKECLSVFLRFKSDINHGSSNASFGLGATF